MTAEKFGTTWWGREWVRLLESLTTTYPNPRLVRGRTLARTGVTNLVVLPGTVSAMVQQGKSTHQVRVAVPTFTDAEWATVVHALNSQAKHLADLLTGHLPTDTGLPLLPPRGDVRSTCGCPDTANPCAHGAAVHYVLARAFDNDPFLLFTLRGKDRGKLLTALHATEGVLISSLEPSTFFTARAELPTPRGDRYLRVVEFLRHAEGSWPCG